MKVLYLALQCLLLRPSTGHAAAAAPSAPAFLDARESITVLACKFVGDGSTSGYKDQLVQFILHIFDKKKSYLHYDHLHAIEDLSVTKE